ncbi:MAG TPA: hypothetical protein PKW05_09865, partial [Anaerolineae bacterium]|nr:hypothetical protein [Anaerolineae bacterium]
MYPLRGHDHSTTSRPWSQARRNPRRPSPPVTYQRVRHGALSQPVLPPHLTRLGVERKDHAI